VALNTVWAKLLSQVMVYKSAYSQKIVREAVFTDLEYEKSSLCPSGSSSGIIQRKLGITRRGCYPGIIPIPRNAATISYPDSPVLHWTVPFLCEHRVRSSVCMVGKTLGHRQWPSSPPPRISEGEAGTVNMGGGHWHGHSYYLPHDSQG
jgi:hypothetical protein